MDYFSFKQLDMGEVMLQFKMFTVEKRALWTRDKNVISYSAPQLRVKVEAGAGAEFCKMLVLALYDVGSINLGSVSD